MTSSDMILLKRQFKGVAKTLQAIYRPDPIVPPAMVALLRTLDMPPAFVVAAQAVQKPANL